MRFCGGGEGGVGAVMGVASVWTGLFWCEFVVVQMGGAWERTGMFREHQSATVDGRGGCLIRT